MFSFWCFVQVFIVRLRDTQARKLGYVNLILFRSPCSRSTRLLQSLKLPAYIYPLWSERRQDLTTVKLGWLGNVE